MTEKINFPIRQKLKSILVPIGCASVMTMHGGMAFAQAALEEVTVTATKRESSLQEVSMSISAIGGDALERAGVTDFTDIATQVPSLSMRSSGPGRTKLNIRGISAATGVAPTVSFYIDEMPVSSISSGSSTSFAQAVVDPKLFDLERIEVLRGPQGTLYGSSSMGGTVRLITRQPKMDEFEAKIGGGLSQTTYGGLSYKTDGMVNAPISESAALRVVGSYTDNEGYFDRVSESTGETFATDVNTEDTYSLRAALRVELGENTYIQPYVFTQKTEMDGKPNYDGPSRSTGTGMNQRALFDAAEPFEDEFTMWNFTLGHEFEHASLLVSASKIDREMLNVEDVTGGFALVGRPAPSGPAFSDENVTLDDETLEIRLTSTHSGPLQWLVGAYEKEAVSDSGYRMIRGWEDEFAPGLANTQKLQNYQESSLFGEISYDLTEKLTVTAGMRQLDYDYSSKEENWGWAFTDTDRSGANVRDAKLSDKGNNYKLTMTYQVTDDAQVYFTKSEGTRPGGINRVIPVSDDPAAAVGYACQQDLDRLGVSDPGAYGGDETDNFEFGLKSMISEGLRLNASIYKVEWQDIQQVVTTSAICGNNFTANIGEAETRGLEVEVAAAISDNLTINAGFGYIDAEFKEDVEDAGIEAGDNLADVPELTYSISADYVMPIDAGEYFVTGNYSFVDSTLELPGKASDDISGTGIDSGNERPDYSIVDLRAGFTSHEGWEATVFIDNVTNKEALYGYNDAIAFAFSGSDPTVRNRPRTVGVSGTYSF